LEENVFRISQGSNVNQLIHQQEQISVKNQIHEQEILIIFDGANHVIEALVNWFILLMRNETLSKMWYG